MELKQSERRRFLKKALALSGVAVFPNILLNKVSGANSPLSKLANPSERINLACCGCGNRGAEIIKELYNTGMVNIVALCDVDMEAEHTLRILKDFPDVPRFRDFRVMFDKMGNQIDAVAVGTPDHSHFPIAMLAMSLGKHVFCEKPMARTFNEVELMTDAAKRHKVVTQMCNQGHSEANYFQFKAWVEAGIIKDVTAVTAHMNMPRRWHGWDVNMKSFPSAEPVPETLDWDTWVAAAVYHDFSKYFHYGNWRSWYDYGLGALGDWGAHIIDTVHRFLDLGLPYEVEPLKLEGHNRFFFPQASTIAMRFPKRVGMPAVELTWYDGVNNIPPLPEGYGVLELDPNIPPIAGRQVQAVKLNPGKIIYSKDLIFKGGSHGSTLSIIPDAKAKDMASKLPDIPKSPSNHYANFLNACKGIENARSSFDIAGQLSQVFCLGVIAQQTNSKLVFDRETKKITNNKTANNLLVGIPPRKGWEQFYKL